MTPHLFFGLCRALALTPLVLYTTFLAARAGMLDDEPATREPEKRPEPRAKLRIVGGQKV